MLGVSQGRLSTLLGHPRPWDQLGPRVRALYARLHLWMDTRATYGNNPHAKQRLGKAARGKVGKKERKPRSLIEPFFSTDPLGGNSLRIALCEKCRI